MVGFPLDVHNVSLGFRVFASLAAANLTILSDFIGFLLIFKIFIGFLCVRCPWVLVYPLGVPEEWFLWWACKPEIHLALIFFTDPLQKLNPNWAHVWHQTRAKVESKVGPRLAPKAGPRDLARPLRRIQGPQNVHKNVPHFRMKKSAPPNPGSGTLV